MLGLNMFRRAAFFSVLLVSALFSRAAEAVSNVSISAASITYAQVEAQQVSIQLDLNQSAPALSLKSALKHPSSKNLLQLQLRCALPKKISTGSWQCSQGLIKSVGIEVPFSLAIERGVAQQKSEIKAMLRISNASLTNATGLHAAEKLSANLQLTATQIDQAWSWQTQLDWLSGEVFWQPFYLASAGYHARATGQLTDDFLSVDQGQLQLNAIGEFNFNGQMRRHDYQLVKFNGSVPSLDLAQAYPLLLQPLLEKTALANVDINGNAALEFSVRDAALKSLDLRLSQVDIADKNHKFAFDQINAHLPWSYDQPQALSFGYSSGTLLNLPLGKTNLQAQVNRYALTADNIRLPVLDGALSLSDISATRSGGLWYWHLRAQLEPINMSDFSRSLNLPLMQGTAAADIPLVTYSRGMLSTDGQVQLNIFDGTAVVTQLTLQQPLGMTPKLNADITLRNLDLGDLTRTFSFGAIEGKLDGDINSLELQNWKPVQFDARLGSSAGNYPKKISQRAVENISALGGAGAAAAIQRSFLRFFKQFNYKDIGLSCKLRNDVCHMSGIEATPQGYVIVKGSGIPSITVMGYNQTVAWSDLLARIKRVTDGNTKAVVN
jgi:hypothetical protein